MPPLFNDECSGAWDFTGNATDGAEGYYIFETSRSLTTPSPESDVQLTPGTEVNFGVSFWDPFETAAGWTDAGHVVTGCSQDWIGLHLVDENEDATPVFDDVGVTTAIGEISLSFSGHDGEEEEEESAEPVESGAEGVELRSASSIVAGTAFTFVVAVIATCAVF